MEQSDKKVKDLAKNQGEEGDQVVASGDKVRKFQSGKNHQKEQNKETEDPRDPRPKSRPFKKQSPVPGGGRAGGQSSPPAP